MLEYLIEVFGSNIWNYAILEATHWSYEKKQVFKVSFIKFINCNLLALDFIFLILISMEPDVPIDINMSNYKFH